MFAGRAGSRIDMNQQPTQTNDTSLSTAVVLCTYNGEAYLLAQLDSLRRQTRLPDFLVLFDDASSDTTAAMLNAATAEFEALGVRVHLHVNGRNTGYVRNFEQAFLAAPADLLFPCDQDDIWHADKIARMTACFESDPALDVLHCDANLVDADAAPMGRRLFEVLEVTRPEMAAMTQGNALDVLIKRNIVTGAAMAFRRRVLDKALPFPAEWAHDEWLALVAALDGRVRTLDEVLIDYRQHANNQIGVKARGVLHKAAGIAGYRKAFLKRMEARYRVLAERAQSMDRLDAAQRARIHDRWAHAQQRNLGRKPLVVRAPIVAGELARGRYHRYGQGIRSALVDLMGLD